MHGLQCVQRWILLFGKAFQAHCQSADGQVGCAEGSWFSGSHWLHVRFQLWQSADSKGSYRFWTQGNWEDWSYVCERWMDEEQLERFANFQFVNQPARVTKMQRKTLIQNWPLRTPNAFTQPVAITGHGNEFAIKIGWWGNAGSRRLLPGDFTLGISLNTWNLAVLSFPDHSQTETTDFVPSSTTTLLNINSLQFRKIGLVPTRWRIEMPWTFPGATFEWVTILPLRTWRMIWWRRISTQSQLVSRPSTSCDSCNRSSS